MIRCLSSKAGVSPSDDDDDDGWSDVGSLGSGTMTGGCKGDGPCAGKRSCAILGRVARVESRQTSIWCDHEAVLGCSIREVSRCSLCVGIEV